MPQKKQKISAIPSVSVIVPFYGDAPDAIKTIKCINNQHYPKDKIQVIIVDNTKEGILINKKLSETIGTKLSHETTPGSYAARNKGIEISTGEILAFTDSDCLPMCDWVSNGIKALLNHGSDIVGGKIEIFTNNPPPNAAELYDMFFGINQEKFINELGFSATANLFIPRTVIKNAGGFNPNLKSSGDKEWCLRAQKMGYKLIYSESAVVRHPARDTMQQVLKKVRRKVGGEKDLKAKNNYPELPKEHWRKKLYRFNHSIKKVNANYGKISLIKVLGIMIAIWLTKVHEKILLSNNGTSRRS